MKRNFIFTSESVTEGHPDKVCDKISDSILDAILDQDKNARVACETMITQGQAIVSGEITTTADVEYETIVSDTLKHIGYTTDELGAASALSKNKHFSINIILFRKVLTLLRELIVLMITNRERVTKV